MDLIAWAYFKGVVSVLSGAAMLVASLMDGSTLGNSMKNGVAASVVALILLLML